MAAINIEMGHLIKEARNKRGITQHALARLMGTSKQLICSWEQGRSEIFTSDMSRLSLILGYDLRWLVFGGSPEEPRMPFVSPSVPFLSSEQITELSLEKLGLARASKWIAVRGNYSKRAFCISTGDDAMLPMIQRGDLVVVDPDVPIEPCRTIAALIRASTDIRAVVREVRFSKSAEPNPPFVLAALKLGYPPISVKKPHDGQLLGAVVEIVRQLPVT